VLTEGEIVWDASRSDFDWSRTDALHPTLRGVFREEPLYLDLRWARSETELDLRNPRFRAAVAELAAPIHGNSPKKGILEVLEVTCLEISPPMIRVSPKFISTSVLTRRVIRLGTVMPWTVTEFERSFELTSGLTCIRSRPLDRMVGTNSSCTPNDLYWMLTVPSPWGMGTGN